MCKKVERLRMTLNFMLVDGFNKNVGIHFDWKLIFLLIEPIQQIHKICSNVAKLEDVETLENIFFSF